MRHLVPVPPTAWNVWTAGRLVGEEMNNNQSLCKTPSVVTTHTAHPATRRGGWWGWVGWLGAGSDPAQYTEQYRRQPFAAVAA